MLNLFLLTGALLQTSTSGLNLQDNPPLLGQIPVISSALVEENISEGTRFSPSLHSGLVLDIQSSLDEQFDMMLTLLFPPALREDVISSNINSPPKRDKHEAMGVSDRCSKTNRS
ncbi:MAG: hypothetical protein COB74_06035 [Shewanella sp.]|nr:MAG: hypothetical protein COB74_06035 [Shewanella sp.]